MQLGPIVREPIVIELNREKAGGFKSLPLRIMILAGGIAVIELITFQANRDERN